MFYITRLNHGTKYTYLPSFNKRVESKRKSSGELNVLFLKAKLKCPDKSLHAIIKEMEKSC
eukprot:snap_masked-scaffold_27-processed-gene-0.25-mRNA-1 protein AED:1.00 eAED:1.00 QI:0/0/0/0/1/1/3/0/60